MKEQNKKNRLRQETPARKEERQRTDSMRKKIIVIKRQKRRIKLDYNNRRFDRKLFVKMKPKENVDQGFNIRHCVREPIARSKTKKKRKKGERRVGCA